MQKYWKEERSIPEISKMTNLSQHFLYRLMRQYRIPRRSLTESNYVVFKSKPRFQPKQTLAPEEEKLKIAGLMLYWAEGAQTGTVVDFANSKPEMVQLFLRFLRQICGISESRLRVYLYHHGSSEKVEESKKFWHYLTGIPLEQFSRPYIRKDNPHRSHRVMLHGLVHIRYSDKRLLQLIQSWIGEYIQQPGAGTQAVNGARL